MVWAVESSRRVSDEIHVEAAAREKRIILTEDSDFSGLVAGKAKAGIHCRPPSTISGSMVWGVPPSSVG